MKPSLCLLLALATCGSAFSQSEAPAPKYTIDLSTPEAAAIESGHLKVGGTNPAGIEINANSSYLTRAGKPWFPVMGEFHYSRYPRAMWEEELLKMKAGGIDIVSTYVFWIHHEEVEGEWDWSDNHDLRAFVQLCAKHGLLSYPRLGPWAHGEVRNGGLPDWLLKKCGKDVRKDAEPYLGEVRKYYSTVTKQLEGLLWKDGGPIVGTQVENELTNNPAHLLTLKTMARELGLDVPLYTVTGWMRVKFPADEVLPVFGGYPDAFWANQTEGWDRRSRKQYFFTMERDDSTIGADVAKTALSAEFAPLARYPYATCELGGGMQPSYRRRPEITADDVAALALCKIGSGSNLQGYYMYHGGANPMGKLSTLQESRVTNYPNDVPVINYDFQAPLGQYGQRRESYGTLRTQHLFLHDFGSDLATLRPTLPDERPASLDDITTLRWSARSDSKRGYIFINNYQRIEGLPARDAVQFQLKLASETLKIPNAPIRIPAQSYTIWPFNMDLNGVLLKYATAQPFCRVGDTFVFFANDNEECEFVFDPKTQKGYGEGVTSSFAQVTTQRGKPNLVAFGLTAISGAKVKILLLTGDQAKHCYKSNVGGEERLFISDAGVVFSGDTVRMESRNARGLDLLVYPQPETPSGTPEGEFKRYTAKVSAKTIPVKLKRIKAAAPAGSLKLDAKKVLTAPDDVDFERAGVWHVSFPKDALDGVREAFLRIDYKGDVARAYVGDKLIDDDFYLGKPWEIGLKRFAPQILEKGLTIKILPLRKDAPIYLPNDRKPAFEKTEEVAELLGISVEPEYQVNRRVNGAE